MAYLASAIHLGEFLAGGFEAEAEMLGQPLHVTLVERDQGIGAAIARTLRTIIKAHGVPPESPARLLITMNAL
jgi:hypothetical protein